MSWPTGDTLNPRYCAVRFKVPYSDWVVQALLGSTIELGSVLNWDDIGDILPSTIANVFSEAFMDVDVQNLTIGQVVCFAADNMQYIGQNPANGASQWLKCEGQTLTTTDYPDLFAVIGYAFGGSGTSFLLPDMRSRVVVDAGHGLGLSPYSLGDMTGEETHDLTSDEMPSHNHTESIAVATVINGGLEAPASSATPSIGTTGFTGGGVPHNNIQPVIALFYYIQVRP